MSGAGGIAGGGAGGVTRDESGDVTPSGGAGEASASAAATAPRTLSNAPRTKNAKPAIACRRLTKNYGDATVVSSLNLTIGRGEIFGLLGPNGAGKTTTILMLLGLTEPTSGTVRVLGLNPAKQSLDVKRRVGYLPDSVGFYPAMTGRANLGYTARLNGMRGAEAGDRVAHVLEVVGLVSRADDRVGAYSRGMTQRLGIADALIKDPEVLILDEPTVGLDPQAAESVLKTITSLASEHGVTVLLASHLLTQVQAICHRIGIFVRGSLVAAGSIDELAATRGGRIAIEVEARGGDPSPILKRLAGVVDVRPDGAGWLVGAQSDVREQIAIQLSRAGFVVTHLRQRPEELGAIYRRYFAEDQHDAA
jgi:ABC-2 type transport system ATP-binding protein